MKTFKYSVLIYFISVAVLSGCSVKSRVEQKAWYKHASKYDQAMIMMWESDGAIQDLKGVFRVKKEFLRAIQPTEREMISVLRSPDRSLQRVALAAMSLKPIETDQLTDILFDFLQDQDPYFRWYTLESLMKFTKFPEARQADLGEKLLEIVKTRKNNKLFPRELSLLAKFPSEEAAVFLTEQMMKEGKESRIRLMRYAAFRALKEMGDSYYDQAAEHVNKHGSPEIKEELLGWEESLERVKTSKPEKNNILENLLE